MSVQWLMRNLRSVGRAGGEVGEEGEAAGGGQCARCHLVPLTVLHHLGGGREGGREGGRKEREGGGEVEEEERRKRGGEGGKDGHHHDIIAYKTHLILYFLTISEIHLRFGMLLTWIPLKVRLLP